MTDIVNFFTYGELMNENYFREKGLEYLAKFTVTLSAWKVVFNKVPGKEENAPEGLGRINIEPTPDADNMMFGVLYEMDEKYLPKLDALHKAPKEYVRKVLQFTRHDFTQVKGLTYVAHPDYVKQGLKPDQATMKILKGARKELPMLYFSRLMNVRKLD